MKTTVESAWFGVHVSHGACGVIEPYGELDLAGVPMLESAVRDLELSTAQRLFELTRLARLLPFSDPLITRRDRARP